MECDDFIKSMQECVENIKASAEKTPDICLQNITMSYEMFMQISNALYESAHNCDVYRKALEIAGKYLSKMSINGYPPIKFKTPKECVEWCIALATGTEFVVGEDNES